MAWVVTPVRIRQLETRADVRTVFYGIAHKLVADDTIPDEIVRFVAYLGRTLDSRRTALLLLAVHLGLRGRPSSAANGSLVAQIRDLPRATRSKILEAVVVYVLACSYNNLISGHILRRSLLNGLVEINRTKDSGGHLHVRKVRAVVDDERTPTLADLMARRAMTLAG